jgi:predicted RNA-binding protein
MQQTFTLVSDYLKTTKNKQQPENVVDVLEPSDYIIQNILNYSKALSIKKSKIIDFIEVVVN